MVRLKTIQTVFLAFGLALIFSSCDPDDDNTCCDPTNPECENYDPCWNVIPTADFRMRGTSVGFPVSENLLAEWCDTIYKSGVEFKANMQNAVEYRWYIGSESTPRSGSGFKLGFQSYLEDTLQNLNPDNQDYFLPLQITLEVRNDPGQCVTPQDTLISHTRYLVFTRKTLVIGTFRGYVEGENFTRDVIFWQNGEDLSNPNFAERYFTDIIGLPNDDTLRIHGIIGPTSFLASYKKRKWDEELNDWWIATDGIKLWDQTITTFPEAPDRVDLYYERIPMDGGATEIVNFSGERI